MTTAHDVREFSDVADAADAAVERDNLENWIQDIRADLSNDPSSWLNTDAPDESPALDTPATPAAPVMLELPAARTAPAMPLAVPDVPAARTEPVLDVPAARTEPVFDVPVMPATLSGPPAVGRHSGEFPRVQPATPSGVGRHTGEFTRIQPATPGGGGRHRA